MKPTKATEAAPISEIAELPRKEPKALLFLAVPLGDAEPVAAVALADETPEGWGA